MPILKTLQRALKAERKEATVQALSGSETVLAHHHCNNCGTEVWANHMAEAHCPVCASHDMEIISDKVRTTKPNRVEAALNDEVLAHLGTCPTCDTSFVGNPSLALASHMHCTVCGTHMAIAMDDSEADEDMEDEEMMDEDSEDMESEEIVDEEYSDEDDMEDESDEDSDDMEDEDEMETEEEDSEESDEEEIEAKAKQKRKVVAKAKTKTKRSLAEIEDALPNAMDGSTDLVPMDDPQDETLKGDQSTLSPEQMAMASKTSFKINLLRVNASRLNNGELPIAFTKHGGTNRWLVTAGNITVATTNPEKVASHLKGIYASQKFCLAFETAIQNGGLTEEVEKNFGLEPVVIEQDVPVAVAELVKDQIAEIKKEYSDKLNQVTDHAEQTIDIAMCKIAKGLNGKPNALRVGLINSLAANGVEHPQGIVDKVFAEHIGEFISDSLEEAKKLQEKPTESLNEISDLTAKAAFSPVEINEGSQLQSALKKKLPVHSEPVNANVVNIQTPRRNIWA